MWTTATEYCGEFWRSVFAAAIVAGWVFGTANTCGNQVTYQVNMGVQRALGQFDPVDGDTILVSGTFSPTDWSTTSTLTPSATDSNTYAGTFENDVAAGSWESHKFIINPGGNSPANQLIWESGNNRSFQAAAEDQTLPLVYFDNLTNAPAPGTNAPIDFLAGADMSHLRFFEDRGVSYRVEGQAGDALEILRDHGINCVRLRLFTSTAAQAQADPYNYINNLDYTVPLAVRVKQAGLKLLLDFHYSDSWADPGKQYKPATWANLTFEELESQIRNYSSNTIASLRAAGASPDFVQVGNEITPGLLWDDGRVGGAYDNPVQWAQLGRLLKAGIQGVNEAAGTNRPGIIIHVDRGGNWGATQWFFDNLAAQSVPYDIIGLSFYPFWHGTLDDLRLCLRNAAARFQKPLIVSETAFPFNNSTNIYNLPASPEGQVQFLLRLAEVVKAVPGGRGAGVFWWAAEYQQLEGYGLAGFHRRSLFYTNGNVLPAAAALGQMRAPVVLSGTLTNTTLRLNWPLSGAGMSLTSATSLNSSATWHPVTNSVSQSNLSYGAAIPLEAGTNRFFRLQSN